MVALDAPEVDDALFTALAKGADQALKITDGDSTQSTLSGAYRLAQALSTVPGLLPADLILTGAQAIDDLDGMTSPLRKVRLRSRVQHQHTGDPQRLCTTISSRVEEPDKRYGRARQLAPGTDALF